MPWGQQSGTFTRLPLRSFRPCLSASLGLSQLSLAIAPTLTLCIFIINFFIFYRAGVSYKLCGLLSIAFLAAPDSLRYALQARFEIYQTLFTMLFFVSIQQGLKIGNVPLQFVSGLFLAAAGYSYYQFFSLALFALSCVVLFNVTRGQTELQPQRHLSFFGNKRSVCHVDRPEFSIGFCIKILNLVVVTIS